MKSWWLSVSASVLVVKVTVFLLISYNAKALLPEPAIWIGRKTFALDAWDSSNQSDERRGDLVLNAVDQSLKRQEKRHQQRLDPLDQAIQTNPSNLDAMRARAALLRKSILKQQVELQKIEREIICCSQGQDYSEQNQNKIQVQNQNDQALQLQRVFNTFTYSTNVLLRKLSRVRDKIGPSNQQWRSVGDYVVSQTATGARIVGGLVQNPQRLKYFVDPETPTLVPHVPAILARLDKLEMHVNPILERVLNNRRHLASIEPYLDDILERFDDIEPHLPWILDNIDTLAPYCGLLLKHIDELLLYADADDYGDADANENGYALAEQLLPYLEYYVSRLDVIGPHLPLLRPHVPKLLQNNRIGNISPHIDRLFARGYRDLSASANLDVLLFWFGWTLRIPGLPRLFFALPGSPRIVSFLANRLPKRFVRGYCRGVTCLVDNDYGGNWNKLKKES
jgi:hypothetical protein